MAGSHNATTPYHTITPKGGGPVVAGAPIPYLGTNHTTMTKSRLGTTSDLVHIIIIPIESV